jgi:CubicO group peptidase (beta-lactamase class C family)
VAATRSSTPTEIQPTYSYIWWLNTGQELWASARASSFAARGGGSNIVWVDPEHDLVVDGVLQRILAAVRDGRGEGR